MPDSINKVCSVQFDIHKYIQHLDSFCRVDENCKGINRNNYSWFNKAFQITRAENVPSHPHGLNGVVALSSAEAPARYPYKISNNRKNRKRAGEDGKRDKAGTSLLSFPFLPCPARSLFLSPQPPHNTKRPLRRTEGWWYTVNCHL